MTAKREEESPRVDEQVPAESAAAGVPETSRGWADSGAALARPSALQLYLSKISQYPILTPEQEHELAVRYAETGDRDAAFKLVTSNLRLVVKISLDFQRAWMNNLLDLIQEGNVGLMQAVNKFDPYRGVRLTSYSSYWIKAYVLKFILDNWRLVRIGKTQAERKLFFKLYKEKQKLDQLGFEPGPRLIAERLQVKEKDVIEMDQRLGAWEVSLEKPIRADNSSTTPKDLLPAPARPLDERLGDDQLRQLIQEKIQEFRKTLKGRDREILEERLLTDQPLTLQELGDRYGITKERTRQIESRLLAKIRHYLVQEIPDAEELIPDLLAGLSS
ncbi:MAG: RNA polymerase factor sigma-32 [bacterium]